MEARFKHLKEAFYDGMRVIALLVVLAVTATFAVLAFDNNNRYEDYGLAFYDYNAQENNIHIEEIYDYGNITVYTSTYYYSYDCYEALEYYVSYNAPYYGTPHGYYYDYAQGSDFIDYGPSFDGHPSYEYNDYGQVGYSPSEYLPGGGYIGYAPDYVGITPLGAGRVVTFSGNPVPMPVGHGSLETGPNGDLASHPAFAGMPLLPIYVGRRFMWWSRYPSGRDANGDPCVVSYSETFGPYTYVPHDMTVYAVWGDPIVFLGNTTTLLMSGEDIPVQDNPNYFDNRFVPYGWTLNEAIDFGVPVVFPNAPNRQHNLFWGWYSVPISSDNLEYPAPSPAVAIDGDTEITGNTRAYARWRLNTHLVMFDMNHDNAVLAVGEAARPHRLYRWALHGRSIADSGLGGDATFGQGNVIGSPVSMDGSPWNFPISIPNDIERQNNLRPWVPNYPFGHPNHVPRTSPDFRTPYPSSEFVRGTAGGLINAYAGTMWPRSAPAIDMEQGTNGRWTPPFGSTTGSNASERNRYTLEGWWTTPYGWRYNTSGNIVSQRFAPAGRANTHISSNYHPDPLHSEHARPAGFPFGLARTVPDSPYSAAHPEHINNPPTGIVTEDMTVYANWVFRVTFHLNLSNNQGQTHGNQGFSLEGTSAFNPNLSNLTNYRDILPHLSDAQRTIGQSGQRVRATPGGAFAAHEPILAGFPPNPSRPGHFFNGWWDRPMNPRRDDHVDNCLLCNTMEDYPVNHHDNAVRITADMQIDGSFTAYAHWIYPTADDYIFVVFHLNPRCNVTGTIGAVATRATEGERGYAYWPTHRPYFAYGNEDQRFFLSHRSIGIPGTLNHVPGPVNLPGTHTTILERNHRYTSTHHNLEFANVAYDDRYAPSIIRQRVWNNPINGNLDPVTGGSNHMDHRFPRNPRRPGYVFVGWSVNYDLSPLNDAGTGPRAIANAASSGANLHAPVANLFWNNGRFLNETAYLVPLAPGGVLNLHAIWAPAFDLTLRGNGNTGPEVLTLPANTNVRFTNAPPAGTVLTEVIRPMPLAGFNFNELQTHSHGWSSPLQGMVWFPNFFVFQYTYSSSVTNLFTRPAGERDRYFGLAADAGTIMPAASTLSPFNTDQQGRPGYGERIATNTRFSPAFFARNNSNALQTRPDGTLYMTAYVQWGRWLTFYGNHQTIAGPAGVTRRVLVPVGDSVNDIINAATRNTNAPDVRHFWEGGAGQWAGTMGTTGTRGGWPIDPAQETPPRNFDVSGGDWHALFHHPNIQGSILIGWHRNPNGDSCINCQAGIPNEPTCIHNGEGCWFDASTPILRTTTIYAIWDTYIIFEPGIGGSAVDMGPVGDLRRPVPGPGNQLNPVPGDPVWGNADFLGWFRVPYFDRTLPSPPSYNPAGTNFDRGMRLFAVFGADVRFVPYGPHSLAAGGFLHSNPGQATVHRDIAHISGDHIRIIHYDAGGSPLSVPRRPGGWLPAQFTGEWFSVICRCADDCAECGDAGTTECIDFTHPTCSHCDPYDINNREIFRPRNHPGNPTPYGTVIGSMRLYPVWRSRVTFWPGHARGMLETYDGIAHASVMRAVPEGLTLSTNDALEQVPGVHLSPPSPAWTNDPGLNFMGWRKINQNGQPLRYRPDNNGLLVPLDPEEPLHVWTCDEIANMRAVLAHHHFEAIWQPNLMFYKLRTAVNPGAHLGHYPLPGVRFVLECITTGVRVYPPVSDDPDDPTYIVSGGTGRVYIGRTLAPDLWLPSLRLEPGWNGILTFRLREILAPEGYMTPDGYWIVTINTAANLGQLGTVPVFNFVPNPDLDCHQMFDIYDYLDFQTVGVGARYQFVRNMPYDFRFWKIGDGGVRLDGAHMRMFVYNGIGEPPDVLITQAMVDAGYWSQLGEDRISCSINPMVFRMIPGRYRPCVPDDTDICKHCGYAYIDGNDCFQRRYYRLIEVVPPPGHQMPMGQWHISVQSGMPSAAPPTLHIRLIGDTPMPSIVPISPFVRQTYLIHNRPDFDLPLTGGRGVNAFVLAGASLLVFAAGLMTWIKYKQPKDMGVSYKKLY